jgi:Notch-like protein
MAVVCQFILRARTIILARIWWTWIPIHNTVKCSCSVGFTGDRCQSKDYCVPLPCKNQGVCTSTLTSYKCNCTRGWSGNNCSTETLTLISCPTILTGTSERWSVVMTLSLIFTWRQRTRIIVMQDGKDHNVSNPILVPSNRVKTKEHACKKDLLTHANVESVGMVKHVKQKRHVTQQLVIIDFRSNQ